MVQDGLDDHGIFPVQRFAEFVGVSFAGQDAADGGDQVRPASLFPLAQRRLERGYSDRLLYGFYDGLDQRGDLGKIIMEMPPITIFVTDDTYRELNLATVPQPAD